MLSAKQLAEREKAKKEVKKELYTKILTQICRKIDLYHTVGHVECIVNIPELVFGYPSFDMEQMTVYMHRQVTRLGYRASILDVGSLHVAWGSTAAASKRTKTSSASVSVPPPPPDDDLPSLANLKKAADTLRKKYEVNTK